ncbi:hypothetical protein [Microcystis aeruginosa]|uniref:hypothetical protein n=1 Tax=Microcystis aeruginosa TaxID=1126 RepID=UPI001330DE76|nr:hypothetical protein [Microcystis aeruginosa]
MNYFFLRYPEKIIKLIRFFRELADNIAEFFLIVVLHRHFGEISRVCGKKFFVGAGCGVWGSGELIGLGLLQRGEQSHTQGEKIKLEI